MKKIISLILCLSLMLSMSANALAATLEQDIYAKCTFDTYYENNQGRVISFDDAETALAGTVYDRYAEFRFDITPFEAQQFGGAVLSLWVRNLYENTAVKIYGSATGDYSDAYLLTSYQAAEVGKLLCEVAITDYVKSALERGDKEVTFFVKSTNPVLTIFSSENTESGITGPALRICNEEPYFASQMTFAYPQVSKEQIMADMSATVSQGHPYLLAKKEDFDRVRENAFGKNKYLTEVYNNVKEDATSYLAYDPVPISNNLTNSSYIGRGFEAWQIVAACAFVYQIEGDTTYAERAWKEVEYLCSMPSWGTYQYIDNNQTVFAVALCYDWLYDWLSIDQRDVLVSSLKSKHFDTVYDLLGHPDSSKYSATFYRFYFSDNNHAVIDNTYTFVSALALADVEPERMAYIMEQTFKNMQGAVENLYPDAAWYEGAGYWGYVGPFISKWVLAMDKALGTTYGIGDLECVQNCADYPIYVCSSNYSFILNDTPYGQGRVNNSAKYIYGVLKDDESLQKYCLTNDNVADPFVCLYFNIDADYDAIDTLDLDYDRYFRNNDLVTMRNTWEGNQELFCGTFVQDARLTHGVMNSGTLVLEAFGKQWITNPGRDNYDLAGYFDSTKEGMRWNYYFARAEANSCLVIDPGFDGGQIYDSHDTINKYLSKDRGAYAVTDLTNTYKNTAESYRRGVMLGNERTTFIVQDEVKLYQPEEVYSFYNFNKCDIEISEDKKSVILSDGNKKVKVNILCDADYELSIMSSDPLPTSPQLDTNRVVREIKKLAVHFDSVQQFNLRLEFTPYLTEGEVTEPASEILPIDEWTIPDGEYEPIVAENLIADGKSVADFNSFNRCYNVETLPKSIECVADTSKYDVSVTDSEDGRAKFVILTDKESGRSSSYMLSLPDEASGPKVVDVSNLKELKVARVSATTDDGNVPGNVIDGDSSTRWSASGRQSLTLELSEAATVDCISIAFYSGDVRITYFDMQVSEDGKNWTTVSENESCGVSEDPEFFDLGKVKAKYVRYKGYGTSTEPWNSITEIKIYGK